MFFRIFFILLPFSLPVLAKPPTSSLVGSFDSPALFLARCSREILGLMERASQHEGVAHTLSPQVSSDEWEKMIESAMGTTTRRLETLRKNNSPIVARVHALGSSFASAGRLLEGTEYVRFPYALMAHRPSMDWWEVLQEQGFQFKALSIGDIAHFGHTFEFSRMSLSFDERTIFVNTLFDFDVWLESSSADDVSDPDTALIQPLAHAYFQYALAEGDFLDRFGEVTLNRFDYLMHKHTHLAPLYRERFFVNGDDLNEKLLTHFWVFFRERWALEQQLKFYQQGKANGWHVYSELMEKLSRMDWENPPHQFLIAFAHFYDLEVELVESFWDEGFIVPSPQSLRRE